MWYVPKFNKKGNQIINFLAEKMTELLIKFIELDSKKFSANFVLRHLVNGNTYLRYSFVIENNEGYRYIPKIVIMN